MPKVNIRAYATLGEILGSKNIDTSTTATTVKELIDIISVEYNPKFKERLIDQKTGETRKFYKILVNGRDIDFLDGLKTELKDGDTVAFFPPAGGG